jgi:cellulose biosynthesis protein BcsQ/uncharacterized protein YjbK
VTVLSLAHLKGGVGKTTAAVQLAWMAASGGESTLLWDLDPQGAASWSFRIRPRVKGGAEAVLRDPAALERAIRGTDFERLDLLPADFSYRELDALLSRGKGSRDLLARSLEPLREEFAWIVLDCPPGLTVLSEEVFRVSDALLLPTVPTPLSLRTLAKLLAHRKELEPPRPLALPFFSMVDRRKRLHRDIVTFAREEELGFLETEIPYASAVERATLVRTPLGETAPRSPAAQAFTALWAEVRARLSDPDEHAAPRRKPLRRMLEAVTPPGAPARGAHEAHSGPHGTAKEEEMSQDAPRADRQEIEFKVSVDGPEAFSALEEVLAGDAPVTRRTKRQRNHFFDTADRAFEDTGAALRLREEEGRFLLVAKGAATSEGEVLTKRAEEEVELASPDAKAILSGAADPLEVLGEQLGSPPPRLVASMREAAGGSPIVRLGAFENERTVLGPVEVSLEGRERSLEFELDRTEFPGGRVDFEVEVEVQDVGAAGADELRALFARAGIEWRSAPSKAARFFALIAES